MTGAKFGVNSRDRRKPAQGTIWMLEPAHGTLMVAEVLNRQGNNASQPVKTIGFKTGEAPAALSSLQASRREIKGTCQLFQSQVAGPHHRFDHGRRETFSNGLAKIMIGGQRAAQSMFTAQFLNYGMQFVYHLSFIVATNGVHVKSVFPFPAYALT